MRTVTWSLIGTTVFGVAWLAWRVPKRSLWPRRIGPIGSVQDIQMPVGGVAEDILVEEGEVVKAGQVLMKLDTEATEEQRRSLETAIKLKREQLALKQQEKQRYLEVNTEQITMLENNLRLQTEIVERFDALEAAGAASELQFLSQQNSVEETRGRLAQTKADRFRQVALIDQQMSELNAELADLQGRIAQARVTLRYQQLRSPVDGVVFDLQPTSAGFTAQSTQTVMKVVPDGLLEAKVEVPSNKIGFVKIPLAVRRIWRNACGLTSVSIPIHRLISVCWRVG